jgi:hypothetical protein
MIKSFADLLSRNAEIGQLARAYSDRGCAIKFQSTCGQFVHLVSSDISSSSGGWRVTSFNKAGEQLGYYETRGAYEAFREVVARDAKEITPDSFVTQAFPSDLNDPTSMNCR